MGRSDDNISFGKPHPTMHVPAAQLGSLTFPAGYPQHQNISPLLPDQLRRDTTSRSRENVPSGFPLHYYAQSQPRDVSMHSGAIGGSSAYRSAEFGSAAHVPYGISNRDSLEVSMHSLQDTSMQSSAMVVPSHTINFPAQSYYEGNAIHSPWLHHATPPSDVDASTRSFANNCYISDVGPPAHVPGGIPDRNYLFPNPVPLRPVTVSGPFSGTASYGSKAIAPRYEGNIRHVSESLTTADPVNRRSDHSRHGMAPSHPPPQSSSSIPASRTETLHPSAHQPNLFVQHTDRVVPVRRHDTQRSASPQVYHIDGCLIDEDDLPDQGTNNDIIIVGECLRNDSPCGLWVKADKGSIKRHAQKWHGVARGGDTNIVLCTWAECNTEMQKGAMPRHTLCKHFRETFQCNGCLKKFTRDHCWKSHVAKCTSSGTGHGYSVSYDPSIRTIDVKGMSLR